jgi:hypothetical protein
MNLKIFLLAFGLRLLIILWGEVQQKLTGIDYSDLDYKVYTDGSRYIS